MRRPTAVVLATAVLSALAGCTAPTAAAPPPGTFATGTTAARLAEAGRIRIGTKFDQPGFGLRRGAGRPEGFDVEIATLVAAALGIDVAHITWVETSAGAREKALTSGAVDLVVATYTITPGRARSVTFAGPYYIAGQQIMVRSGDDRMTGPDSFTHDRRLRVCSSSGSTSAARIRPYLADPGQLVTYPGYAQCARALRAGTVDAVTTDGSILLGMAAGSGREFRLAGDPFTEEAYGIGIRHGDVAFCRFVDDVLVRAAADGRYQRAWASTAGQVEGSRPPVLPVLDPCGVA